MNFTVENYIKDCMSRPLKDIYSHTCARFIKKFEASCNLIGNLSNLRQIFFMEAGYQMHNFCTELFKQMDKGKIVNNLYLVNGKLHEAIGNSLQNVHSSIISRIKVLFSEDPKSFKV